MANFFIGHSIDRYGYDKSPWNDPDHFMEQYGKMSRWLNVVTGDFEEKEEHLRRDYENRLKEQNQALEGRVSDLQAQLATLQKSGVVEMVEEGKKLLEELKAQRASEGPR